MLSTVDHLRLPADHVARPKHRPRLRLRLHSSVPVRESLCAGRVAIETPEAGYHRSRAARVAQKSVSARRAVHLSPPRLRDN